MKTDEERLIELLRRIAPARRASLLDYAEFLAARTAHAPEPAHAPRPVSESVVQAVKRLRQRYPNIPRRALMGAIERLMASHMLDGRAAAEVIDELEALFARHAGGEEERG